jgi:hypothetical protein
MVSMKVERLEYVLLPISYGAKRTSKWIQWHEKAPGEGIHTDYNYKRIKVCDAP